MHSIIFHPNCYAFPNHRLRTATVLCHECFASEKQRFSFVYDETLRYEFLRARNKSILMQGSPLFRSHSSLVVPPFPTSSGNTSVCSVRSKSLCQACSNRPSGGHALPLGLISAPNCSVADRKRSFKEVLFIHVRSCSIVSAGVDY
jgi:hypothetical protein